MFKKGMHYVHYEHAMGVEICSGIKFKYGIDMTEGKSTIKYVRFNYKKEIWDYGKSIVRSTSYGIGSHMNGIEWSSERWWTYKKRNVKFYSSPWFWVLVKDNRWESKKYNESEPVKLVIIKKLKEKH
jgi:hypothetical protein